MKKVFMYIFVIAYVPITLLKTVVASIMLLDEWCEGIIRDSIKKHLT